MLALVAMLLSAVRLTAAEPTPEARYLEIYLSMNDAEHLEKAHDYLKAEKKFADMFTKLAQLHTDEPYFEESLVVHRMQDCKAKVLDLRTKIGRDIPPAALAIPRSGPRNVYPWNVKVTPNVIWIGQNGEKGSVWNSDWVRDNNGPDDPLHRNGYAVGDHASGLNPFYAALPFNDLAHPDLTAKWLPAGWQRVAKNGAMLSSCKDRWLEIKNANGDICYAQWEDVGPGADDRAEYVLGSAAAGDAPALAVSPAVSQYLQVGGDAKGQVSWRFVDAADVRPGA